jgi:hypothetical protein
MESEIDVLAVTEERLVEPADFFKDIASKITDIERPAA